MIPLQRVTISTFLLNFNSFSNCVLCVSPSSLTNNSCGKVSVLVKRPGLSLDHHKSAMEQGPGVPERFAVGTEKRVPEEHPGPGR